MGEEEEVRELIGRLRAAQRQGFHLTPAQIGLVLVALRFTLAARVWLTKPHDAPEPEAERRRKPEPYNGPLPTIRETRSHGVVACHVHCITPNCHHVARFTFDALGLADDAVFVDIPRLRRFRCSRCGGWRVEVSADWTDHVAQGNGRRPKTEDASSNSSKPA